MNVLIISAFPPDPAPEANHALHLSEHLARHGYAVHVLCKKGSIVGTTDNVSVHPVMEAWSWSDLPRMARCMRECRPDVVLLLYIAWVFERRPMITFLPTIAAVVIPGVPCVTQFENADMHRPLISLLERAIRSGVRLFAGSKYIDSAFGTLVRGSERLIVLSAPHKRRLVNRCPEAEEKTVIVPPPPLIRFCSDPPGDVRAKVREELGLSPDSWVLIFWGYIYPGKGLEVLLAAFRTVLRRNPGMRLLIAGGKLEVPNQAISCGDYYRKVRRLPETLGIADKVLWTGNFTWDSDAGSRFLYASDICILPFDYGVTLNNSSLAAAAAHGIPVISTELRSDRDEGLEHGKTIYLCPPRDPERLAEAIQLLHDNRELRERLKSGITRLATAWHDWDSMTGRLAGIIESICLNGKAGKQAEPPRRRPPHVSDIPAVSRMTNALADPPEPIGHDSSVPLSPGADRGDLRRPLVSVIVAVHNVGTYLSQCLDALVNQTLRDVEIIVVNDASDDNSAEVIRDYQLRYPEIQVIETEVNIGLASVRNTGMRAATGEYVAFADGDDWVDIRMCEVMYTRAEEHGSEVVIADATVFYEEDKRFTKFFDKHIRVTLAPKLRRMPFVAEDEPRILLLEPVAWTKLYKRSFLLTHGLHFEDGMNSYEDVCFHFSALLKARRISLIDDRLMFYRQGRPGQISGMRSRRVFEVFDVFRKIHENLAAWEVSADVWDMLIRVELRMFDWLLRDRVQRHHKKEFMRRVAERLETIPEARFEAFGQYQTFDDRSKLICMTNNWLHAYERVVRKQWALLPPLYALLHTKGARREIVKAGLQRGRNMLRGRAVSLIRSVARKSLDTAGIENRLRDLQDEINRLTGMKDLSFMTEDSPFRGCRIDNEVFFLSFPHNDKGYLETLDRAETDYFFSQGAIFRPGDVVVDIGAHVGVLSLRLARRFPFLKIYALEPNPLNYQCLKRNIEKNGATNITAVNKGISGDGKETSLFTNVYDSRLATISDRLAANLGPFLAFRIETTTLEQLFREYGIGHCRFLKISALGAVRESLESFRRPGAIDLLSGEADLKDCGVMKLEVESWRIARQHFWRTFSLEDRISPGPLIYQLPNGCERSENFSGSVPGWSDTRDSPECATQVNREP